MKIHKWSDIKAKAIKAGKLSSERLNWKPLEAAGVLFKKPQDRINFAGEALDSLRSRLANTIQRVGELTKQLDDKDAELRATKDSLEAVQKDRDTKIEELHLRCERQNHFVTRVDYSKKECPRCRLEELAHQRIILRDTMVLAQRAMGRINPEVNSPAAQHATAAYGTLGLVLTEEQSAHEDADKALGHTDRSPLKGWLGPLSVIGATVAAAFFLMGKAKGTAK